MLGGNYSGQLGNGSTDRQLIPTDVLSAAPRVALSPDNITFHNIFIGSISTLSLKIKDTGTAPLAIKSIDITGDYTFSHNCPIEPATLAVNMSCDISVTFAPTDVGIHEGVLTLKTDAANSPHLVELEGKGVSPLHFSATSLRFKQPVSSISLPQQIDVTNKGTAPITISAIDLSDDYVSVHSCLLAPNPLAAGAHCSVNIAFVPQSVGTFTGTLTITTEGAGAPVVDLSGNSIEAPVAQWKGSPGTLLFDVSLDGNQWSNFTFERCWSVTCDPFGSCWCNWYRKATVAGPGPIVNNQFDHTGDLLSFTGQFSSTTTAAGTYLFDTTNGNWQARLESPALEPGKVDPVN